MRTFPLSLLAATLVFAGCDSPAAPEATLPAATPTAPSFDTRSATVPWNGDAVVVQRAEFRGGFCFFVVLAGGFHGYSGLSTTVVTPSGNTQYRCKGDLLFGEGVPEVLNLLDVPFDGEFLGPPMPACHVRATPGPKGQAMVTCHMKD